MLPIPVQSESIRKPEEVFLVDRIQHRDGRPLDDFVLKSGNRERALLAIRLRYVDPPRWLCPIHSLMEPRIQVHYLVIEICLVGVRDQRLWHRIDGVI